MEFTEDSGSGQQDDVAASVHSERPRSVRQSLHSLKGREQDEEEEEEKVSSSYRSEKGESPVKEQASDQKSNRSAKMS